MQAPPARPQPIPSQFALGMPCSQLAYTRAVILLQRCCLERLSVQSTAVESIGMCTHVGAHMCHRPVGLQPPPQRLAELKVVRNVAGTLQALHSLT